MQRTLSSFFRPQWTPKNFQTRSFVPVGSEAPDFTTDAVVGTEFQSITLSSFRGKWVLLAFYPLAFTFSCPTEIVKLNKMAGLFKENDTVVLGCSVDSKFSNLAWAQTSQKEGGLGGAQIPLLSDLSHEIGERYSVMNGNSGHHLRGTYLIDPKGIVRHISMNDPPVGRNMEEYLRLVQAFEFADKHGEVCPSDWIPGGDTIKPDPKKSREYFGKHGEE